jgi:hypothetical protein
MTGRCGRQLTTSPPRNQPAQHPGRDHQPRREDLTYPKPGAASDNVRPTAFSATVVVVLVWINGPFGGGKTATAYELQRRLPASIVCDPEHLGFGLRRMLPPALRTDFQELRAWRSGVHEVLDLAARNHEGPVIVPMTLIDSRYFTQIVGGLRDDGHDVRHFALLAERTTVLRRLNRRGFGYGLKHERWAVDRLDECLARLGEPEFADHIHTDEQTVPQVADRIARIAALPIIPDTDGRVRASLRRYAVTLKHIRFD